MMSSVIDLFGELFSGSKNTHHSLKKTSQCARTITRTGIFCF